MGNLALMWTTCATDARLSVVLSNGASLVRKVRSRRLSVRTHCHVGPGNSVGCVKKDGRRLIKTLYAHRPHGTRENRFYRSGASGQRSPSQRRDHAGTQTTMVRKRS